MLNSYDLGTIAGRLLERRVEADTPTEERQAAVAAILRAPRGGGEAEVLLIRRAERLGDPWSGHMAFPGGRRDETDPNLLSAAVRETREEVGIDLFHHATLLGRLPDIPPIVRGRRFGLIIAQFVFALRTEPTLVPNQEVAGTLWTPIGPLARGEYLGTYPYLHEGTMLSLPCHRIGEHVVWGLTYRMLEALFELLNGDQP